ncbi:MAG: hypothetical protein AB7O71_25550 [Hyphomicrobiaceae bacterium]
MIRPTEEMLNAYVDGALDPETEKGVAEFLVQDADARAYVDALRRLNASVPDAMAVLVPDPPQALVDKINAMMALGERKAPSAVRRLSRFDRAALHFPYGIAATLAIALGLALAYTTLTRPYTSADLLITGPLPEDSAVATLLERGRPDDTINTPVVESGRNVRVTLASTFMDKQGRYCREIEIGAIAEDMRQSASIACRTASGVWAVEGSVALESGTPTGAPGLAPSGSDDKEPLAELLRSLEAGRALTSEQIESALARGWK